MGISDREYYRDNTRGSGWFSGESPACNAIILANIIVFVAQKLFDPTVDHWFRGDTDAIFHQGQVWRLLTGTFLHSQLTPMHIAGNMLFLWFVGREMEALYGSRDFTAFYLAAGVVSSLCWAVASVLSSSGPHYAIGASGAVMAVVVVFTLYFPHREVRFMFLVPIEMWVLLVLYLGWDLLQFVSGGREAGEPIAYSAHLGGAAFGFLFKAGDLRLSRLQQRWFRRRPRLRIVGTDARPRDRDREVAPPPARPVPPTMPGNPGGSSRPATANLVKPAPVAVMSEEQFDAKFDEILVKIAREGQGALTDDERRVLAEASRRAQARRSGSDGPRDHPRSPIGRP